MSKQNVTSLLGLIIAVLTFLSCAAPNYLPSPTIQYPILRNTCSFGVQNMDEKAKVENSSLSCHYDGFDVKYKLNEGFVISLEIINNSNKSLIIDKSKCFVLYDGYSTQLFKDVRSSRSTTFNNVQDAINNVQTNEASVSMTIPPYSKWELPLQETNVREMKKLPAFNYSVGIHSLTPFDNQEVIEYVIPYSFDYTMAEWSTSRNRIFVNSIEVKNQMTSNQFEFKDETIFLSQTQYQITRRNGHPDYSEANKIDALNQKKFKKHNTAVVISHLFWGIPTLTMSWWFLGCSQHEPPIYGNNGKSSYNSIGSDKYEDPFGNFFNAPFGDLSSRVQNNAPNNNQGNLNRLLGGEFQEVTQYQKEQLGIQSGINILRITDGKMKDAGIPEGFIIQNINNKTIRNIEDLESIVMIIKNTKEPVMIIKGIFLTGKKGTFVVEI